MMLGGHTAESSGPTEQFEALYLDADDTQQRVPWDQLPDMLDGLHRAARSFPSYRGQRNFPGWYWSATLRRRIGFESWVQRDHLVALDRDPSVIGIAVRPFWLLWTEEEPRHPTDTRNSGTGTKPRRHAPDFLALLEHGEVLVLDTQPTEPIRPAAQEAFEVTARACATLGWRYTIAERLDELTVTNQKWLAGYRHPRCFTPHIAERLLEVFTRPRPLMDGAELTGDPLATLPVLYHLLWTQQLQADLSLTLSDRTIVQSATPTPPAKTPTTVALVNISPRGLVTMTHDG